MHGYSRSTDLLSQTYIYIWYNVASVTGTYYCPNYYPPSWQGNSSGQFRVNLEHYVINVWAADKHCIAHNYGILTLAVSCS